MAHNIQTRDIQVSQTQAWHGLTTIREVVSRQEAHPYELIESPILYRVPDKERPWLDGTLVEHPKFKQLLADDDHLPVGDPYNKDTYTPSSIKAFWSILEKGMGDAPYKVISAGSVNDRRNIFASIKVSEGFRVGDREVKDHISLIDSFDGSTSITALYSSIVVVCENTLRMALNSGKAIGKARHTKMLDLNIQRIIDALDAFSGTSAAFEAMMRKADETPCSRDEARAWYVGMEAVADGGLTNGLKQKTARMVELFDGGLGNSGRTRLDAFSGYTQFHTRESSRGDDKQRQMLSSEWGSSARAKASAATTFERDWTKLVSRGTNLMESDKEPVLAN